MTCRKRSDDIKKPEEEVASEEPVGNLPTAQAVSGYEGGASLVHSSWRNVGTCSPDKWPCGTHLDGAREGEPSPLNRMPSRAAGRTRPVVVCGSCNAGGAEAVRAPRFVGRLTAREEPHVSHSQNRLSFRWKSFRSLSPREGERRSSRSVDAETIADLSEPGREPSRNRLSGMATTLVRMVEIPKRDGGPVLSAGLCRPHRLDGHPAV